MGRNNRIAKSAFSKVKRNIGTKYRRRRRRTAAGIILTTTMMISEAAYMSTMGWQGRIMPMVVVDDNNNFYVYFYSLNFRWCS